MSNRNVSSDGFAINEKKPKVDKSKYAKRRKKPKKLLNIIFSQKTTIILLLLLQFLQLFLMFNFLTENYTYVNAAMTGLGMILGIYILNTNDNPAYKLAWILPLLIMPIFTSVLYLLLSNQPHKRRIRELYGKKLADTSHLLENDTQLCESIRESDPELSRLVNYLGDTISFPVYECEGAQYFALGEDKFAQMTKKMKEAKSFIFMEYFIIDDGEMWGEILDILLEKTKSGVEVKLLCDGMGSQFTIPAKDVKALREAGAEVRIFNKFRPMISTIQNNRDHRKILVIDGNVGFCGGINIADEYINRRLRFGHWKDTAVMISGKAVWNFTMMFLQMWEVVSGTVTDYRKYVPTAEEGEKQGYVIPFADSPLDNEKVGKLVYLHVINNAKRYLYITTPYFIPDHEMMTALELAAKSGVDVRIITPHIPDKWYIHSITRSYYRDLLDIGVNVYEYVPGFIHAKNFLSDDSKAVVGTINIDYRSLYLHFECAAYMQGTECIGNIRRDFDDLFKSKCHKITYEDCKNISFISRCASVFLRIFSPLL